MSASLTTISSWYVARWQATRLGLACRWRELDRLDAEIERKEAELRRLEERTRSFDGTAAVTPTRVTAWRNIPVPSERPNNG